MPLASTSLFSIVFYSACSNDLNKIGALVREGLVVEDPDRRKRNVASIHDTSHMGLNKTADMVSGKYYWPGVTSDVKAYVSSLTLYALYLPICEYLGDNVTMGGLISLRDWPFHLMRGMQIFHYNTQT